MRSIKCWAPNGVPGPDTGIGRLSETMRPVRTVAAARARLGNRAGDFIGVDPPIGRGLGEIPRLAIGPGGMRAAFFAIGETLVDAVVVRLVFNDENAAVGRCSRRGEQEHAGQ